MFLKRFEGSLYVSVNTPEWCWDSLKLRAFFLAFRAEGFGDGVSGVLLAFTAEGFGDRGFGICFWGLEGFEVCLGFEELELKDF